MRNQRGQFLLESVLLMIVFMSIVLLVVNHFKSNQLFASIVKGPWSSLSGMLQNGEWMAADKGAALHPSQHGRHVTIKGETP